MSNCVRLGLRTVQIAKKLARQKGFLATIMEKNEKFEDPVHGLIVLPEIISSIKQSSYFRRLKDIQQLSFHPGGHSRYEHCIGTYHLTNKFLNVLEKNSNGLRIPEFYKNCVCIAGLLHDVGHGPFSHFWETVTKECHEKNSLHCIEKIFESVPQKLSNDREEHDFGIDLIKYLITGDKDKVHPEFEFEFLFEIVNNKYSGIDVDKWDYLKRDTKFFYKRAETKFDDLFYTARVSNDRKHIEYKSGKNIADLYITRQLMHIKHYKDPLHTALAEILRCAILHAVDRGELFMNKRMTEITSSDDEFLHLNDKSVIETLKQINDVKIKELINIFECQSLRECNADEGYDHDIKIEVPYAGEFIESNKFQFEIYGEDKELTGTELGTYTKTHYFRNL